jgi:hypothetical protein
LVEYFNMTASLIEEVEINGEPTTVVHEFLPASSIVTMQHKNSRATFKIVDNTAVTLRGSVMIDPNAVGGYDCSFQGVTVELVDGKGMTKSTVSEADGSFSFSLSRGETVKVRIPEFRGHTWAASLMTLNSVNTDGDAASADATSRRLLHVERDVDLRTRRALASAKTDVADLMTGEPLLDDYWMETGQVTLGDQEWVSVMTTSPFDGDFSVFISSAKSNSSDERFMTSARLRSVKNLLSHGNIVYFEAKLFQANDTFCSKQWRVPSPIEPTEFTWMVVKSGAFELSNNVFFVGSSTIARKSANVKSSANLRQVNYPSGLSFAAGVEVSVIAQLQSLKNDRLVVPRVASVSHSFAIFTMDPASSTSDDIYPLNNEKLAYMAYSMNAPLECADAFWSLESQLVTISHLRKNIDFQGNFAVVPSIFGVTTVDFAQRDVANLRVEDVTTSGAGVMMQEDQCHDEEMTTTLGRTYMLVMGENHHPAGRLQCGIKTNVVPPTNAPTHLPTAKPTSPTSVPSSTPSAVPTISPTSSMPSSAPTSSPPTEAPTAMPSISHMPTMTFAPTATPETISITAKNGSQLLLAYTFDSVSVVDEESVVTDSVNGLQASLHGVWVENGDAVFGEARFEVDRVPVPYIRLPVAPLGRISVATIEIWASFNNDHDPLSTLFSFGPDTDAVNLLADFTGERDVYLAVVFDAIAGQYKLFKNALLVETGVFDANFVFGNLRVYDQMGFIGRGSSNSTAHSMSASVHDFRVTYGALSRSAIYSQYRVGTHAESITLMGVDTMADIDMMFYATTKQMVEVGMYGGPSRAGGQRIGGLEMFGPETKFVFEATDYMCDYSFEVALNRDGSPIQVSLAAINYSVTLVDSVHGAPQYTEEAANLFHPSAPFFCDDSKPPLQYFEDADQLNQTIEIITPNSSYFVYNFTYVSGVCMTVAGSDDFSADSGILDLVVGESCFRDDATLMKEGSSLDVKFFMYERYPVENHWIDTSSFMVDSPDDEYTPYDINPLVAESTITIYDLVSGFNSPQVIDYDDTVDFAGPLSRVRTPVGNPYKIVAKEPLPSIPYSWKFRAVASRSGVDGFSTAEATWFIPVTGVLGKEVPNLYPVASDPNLIFMVLRDPPGGNSQSTIHAGKSVLFDFNI